MTLGDVEVTSPCTNLGDVHAAVFVINGIGGLSRLIGVRLGHPPALEYHAIRYGSHARVIDDGFELLGGITVLHDHMVDFGRAVHKVNGHTSVVSGITRIDHGIHRESFGIKTYSATSHRGIDRLDILTVKVKCLGVCTHLMLNAKKINTDLNRACRLHLLSVLDDCNVKEARIVDATIDSFVRLLEVRRIGTVVGGYLLGLKLSTLGDTRIRAISDIDLVGLAVGSDDLSRDILNLADHKRAQLVGLELEGIAILSRRAILVDNIGLVEHNRVLAALGLLMVGQLHQYGLLDLACLGGGQLDLDGRIGRNLVAFLIVKTKVHNIPLSKQSIIALVSLDCICSLSLDVSYTLFASIDVLEFEAGTRGQCSSRSLHVHNGSHVLVAILINLRESLLQLLLRIGGSLLGSNLTLVYRLEATGTVHMLLCNLFLATDKLANSLIARVIMHMLIRLFLPAHQHARLLVALISVRVQFALLEGAHEVAVSVIALSHVRVRGVTTVLAVQHRHLVGHGSAVLTQHTRHAQSNHERHARKDGKVARVPLVRQQQLGNALFDSASHRVLPPLGVRCFSSYITVCTHLCTLVS